MEKVPVVEFRNVSRIYGDRTNGTNLITALDDVTFKISRGEFLAITGPSGSGKSTLLHLIGLLDKQSEGKILIDGVDTGKLKEEEMARLRNKKIGFVFQQFNLLRATPAIRNVELPLIYGGVRAKERSELAKAELIKVGLGDRLTNRPSQLSGGQQQRVAIARALVTNPSLILADEPTGNLDSKTGADIIDLFHELHKSGVTVVLVTHDREVASRARRQIVIKDGKIV